MLSRLYRVKKIGMYRFCCGNRVRLSLVVQTGDCGYVEKLNVNRDCELAPIRCYSKSPIDYHRF